MSLIFVVLMGGYSRVGYSKMLLDFSSVILVKAIFASD